MKLSLLDQTHPSYSGPHLECLGALYSGGRAFKTHIRTFLPQNPVEPDDVYVTRQKEAHYRSYMSTIIDHYTSWLFSGGFVPKATNRDDGTPLETDSYYSKFIENCDEKGSDFEKFVSDRMRQALIDRKSHCLLEKPSDNGIDPGDKLDYIKRGLGNVTVCPVNETDIWDWETDEDGNLLWFNLHATTQSRESISQARDMVTEIWRIYDSQTVTEFKYTYKRGERSKDPNYEVSQGPAKPHGFSFVPLVSMELPEGMWVADKIESAQLEHFRLSSAMAWLIRRTCYCMPVFKLENQEKPPIMGTGYFIMIGKDDDVEWSAPPNTPFDVIGREVDKQREEIFRITHQMALGLSNNADTAGRSADSKEFDVAATRVMLTALSQIASAFIEAILDRIAEARGDLDLKWNVEGFNGFDVATVSQLINSAQQAKLLGIPSRTFHRLTNIKTALAMHPDANDHDKSLMVAELTEAADKMKVGEALDPQRAIIEQQQASANADNASAEASIIMAKKPAPAVPNN